jgi:hypothetical protein
MAEFRLASQISLLRCSLTGDIDPVIVVLGLQIDQNYKSIKS